MNSKGVGLVVVLIALIGLGIYFFGGVNDFAQFDNVEEAPTDDRSSVDTNDTVDETVMLVAYTYVGNIHTYIGEINLPTPCHELDSEVIIAESFPEQVSINFTIASEVEMCAQVITPEPFVVSFEASKDASVAMTVNGEEMAFRVVSSDEAEEHVGGNTIGTTTGTTTDDIDETDVLGEEDEIME